MILLNCVVILDKVGNCISRVLLLVKVLEKRKMPEV